jgi:DNA-binding GntR family transcriptional regulator
MRIKDRLPRETGRDYALRILKENIIHMELEPGSRVSENELSASLGLSRTPVREALIELSKVGIVEIYPQKGSVICPIDFKMVDQAYFLREVLECEVVSIACQDITEEGLKALRANLAQQEEFARTGGGSTDATFMDLDNAFHETLFNIAGKPMIFRLIQDVVIHFDRIRNLTIRYMTPSNIVQQHQAILSAVEDRDGALASALMRNHLSKFRGIEHELREQFPGYFRD